MERLASNLTRRAVAMPELATDTRAQLLARYRPVTPVSTLREQRHKPHFYISHAISDAAESVVRRLVKTLESRFGREAAFWDDMVQLGAPWEASLKREFDRADALVVVAGPGWGSTVWTQRELRWALDAQKPVIPLLIQNTSWRELPLELQGRRGFKLEVENEEQGLTTFVAQLPETFSSEPVTPRTQIADIDDPQKGQWGGLSERDGRRLTAQVWSGSNDWFQIGLSVERTGGEPLEGDVEFHLHPSFHPSLMRVPSSNDSAHLKVHAWGAFTVGVSTDAGRTLLELNLADLSEAPEDFRSR